MEYANIYLTCFMSFYECSFLFYSISILFYSVPVNFFKLPLYFLLLYFAMSVTMFRFTRDHDMKVKFIKFRLIWWINYAIYYLYIYATPYVMLHLSGKYQLRFVYSLLTTLHETNITYQLLTDKGNIRVYSNVICKWGEAFAFKMATIMCP